MQQGQASLVLLAPQVLPELVGPLAPLAQAQQAQQELAPQALQAQPVQQVQELQALLGPQELAAQALRAPLALKERRARAWTVLAAPLVQRAPQVLQAQA